MSLNLNSVVLTQAYDAVRNGTSKWVLYTLTASNDLKIEEVGDGSATLRDLADEFSDGKIQFAFASVVDATSKLQKFVLINWCGDGVPVARKSRFHTYASDIARVFTGAHVVLQARQESDVEPDIIRKRVAESGGSKYTTAGTSSSAQPAKMERPAPVGTNYTPIGRPDIASMTSSKPQAPPTVVGSTWTPKHNELQDICKTAAASSKPAEEDKVDTVVGTTWQPKHNELQEIRAKAARDRPEAPAAVGTTWQPRHNELQEIRAKAAAESQKPKPEVESSTRAPFLPPGAGRPVPVAQPSPSPAVEKPKPTYERPEPVGTSYTPVSVPKAGKLGDRLAAFQQQPASSSGPQPISPSNTGGKKLTWSERQALAKKQREEEEAASASAIEQASARNVPPAPSAPAAPPAPAASAAPPAPSPPQAPPAPQAPQAPAAPPAPPAPAAPPMSLRAPSGMPAPPKAPGGDDEDWDADDKSGSESDMGPVRAPPMVNMAARPTTSAVPQAPPPPPAPGAETGAAAAVLSADQEKADADREAEEQADRLDKLKLAEEEAHEAAAVPRPRGESAVTASKKAKVIYDYQAEEGNELDLAEGDIVTDIDQIDDGWWSGTVDGRSGLFPANYVELIEEQESAEPPRAPSPPPAASAPLSPPAPHMPARPEPTRAKTSGPRARALYDYAADEDNEVSFNEGDEIVDIQFDSDDWWSGSVEGKRGLFPSNYVEMIEE